MPNLPPQTLTAAALAELVKAAHREMSSKGGSAGGARAHRRGGKTKAQRAAYYAKLARKSNRARARNKRNAKSKTES